VQYGNIDNTFIGILRLTGRWSVPFFFMLSGYFYQNGLNKAPINALKKNLFRIGGIILIANLIYLPILLLDKTSIFQWKYIILSDYFHLWFLNSLFGGVIVLYVIRKLKSIIQIGLVLTILIAGLLGDSYSFILKLNPEHFNFYIRPFLSIPFMLIGANFNKISTSKLIRSSLGYVLLITGVIFQIGEVAFLSHYFNKSLQNHQFLVGIYVSSIGIFVLALSLRAKTKIAFLGKWGEKYALFIYIYHPLMIYFLQSAALKTLSGYSILLYPVLIFILTLLTAIFLDKRSNTIFRVASGTIKKLKFG
jgi:surface polysaccharide O-acyltransferase-like enzyme